ncbi:MAG: glycosyl hydrolase [Clostridia bacterium]
MKLEKLYSVKIPADINLTETSQLCGDIGDQPNQANFGAHIFLNSKFECQTMAGIGGAFSELGGKALLSLDKEEQNEVAKNLFADKFNYFRLPVGSSDFGLDAYSLNDVANDFEMEHFSLERDEKFIIPYMNLAKEYSENLKVHASPWSPPYWLKDNMAFGDGGSIVDDDKYYVAYAKYFLKLVNEYKKKGFDIARINIQNEPDVDPKYPSCLMSVEQMAKFIREYLFPLFKEENIDTEIFAGTFRAINEATACDFLTVDNDIQNYISGIGCQYHTMGPLNQINAKFPNLKIMHTESNCFHGENSWEQAIALYMNIINYINAGCDVFSYWNMILNTNAESTWGWKQNSLVTIDEESKTVTYNPDYYVMALASACIKPNAKRIVYASRNKTGMAFKNEDGTVSFMLSNFTDKKEIGDVTLDGKKLDIQLEPMTISAYKITL